jgi:Tfp pilus assembly protein PilF
MKPSTRTRSAFLDRARTLAAVSVLALAASPLAGCGDETPAAKTPVPGGGTVGQGDLGQAKPGQQWGMSDAPSSAGMTGDRPKMNDSALKSYQQGMQAFIAGDLATAKKFFQEATGADPKAYQAFYSLGVVQERLKDDGALASYRQAYTILPDYEPAIVAYGLLKARKGQTSEADSFLTQKRGELSKSAAVCAALAEVKSLAKDSGNAQKLAQEALKLNPDYRPAMVVIARDHYRNRRLDLALYALQAILDGFEPVADNPPRDKDNAEALMLRGLIYKEQGNRPGAIDQFQKALARRPDLVEARVQLATFLLEAGDATQAQPLLEGALRFDADNVPAHLLLGDCYRLQGRFTDAKQRFDYVVGKDASMPMVHYDLGLLYLFAPSIPGMTPMQQVDSATAELKKYQSLRDKGISDDSDELLNRAKLKRGELEAAAAAAAPPKGGDASGGAAGGDAKGGAAAGGDAKGGAAAGGDAKGGATPPAGQNDKTPPKK